MARKDLMKYYDECKVDYLACIDCLKNLDQDLQENPTSEAEINAIRKELQPAIDTFNFMRGVVYLLNLPNRPKKKKKFLKNHKTPDGDYLERMLKENEQMIKKK